MCDESGELQDGPALFPFYIKSRDTYVKKSVLVFVRVLFVCLFLIQVSCKYVKVGSRYLLKHLTNQHLIQKCVFIYLIYRACTGKYKHRAGINVPLNLEALKLLIITFHRPELCFSI